MLASVCCPTLGKVGECWPMLAYIVVPRTGPQNITKNNSLGVAARDGCGQNALSAAAWKADTRHWQLAKDTGTAKLGADFEGLLLRPPREIPSRISDLPADTID